ncbi:MAG: ABC transporter substrate-binding protein [Dehalococcoidia bacterium]
MRSLVWPWLLAVVGAFALVSACGGEDEPSSSSSATATRGPTAQLGDIGPGITDTEIRLGIANDVSATSETPHAAVGLAISAYFAMVNQEGGGVCGRELVLVLEDDTSSERDQIAAFIGNVRPDVAQQDPPDLFVDIDMDYVTESDTVPTIVFRPSYEADGQILGGYINDNLAGQTAATLYQDDDFGRSGRDAFTGEFAGDIVAEESYESTATDINSQLATLRNAAPDILYLYSTPVFTALAFAYMTQNDWHPLVVMSYVNSAATLASSIGGGTEVAQITAGFAAIAGSISNNYILDPVADADDPALVEHIRIMETYNGPPVSKPSVNAQAIAETVVQTLDIACENDDLSRSGMVAAAASLNGFHPSVLREDIELMISETDHSAIQSLIPVQIRADGTLAPLVTEPIEAGG